MWETEQLLAQHPFDEEILFFVESIYTRLGKYQRAIPVLEQLLEWQPDSDEVYFRLAVCLPKPGKLSLGRALL
ncbi:MAG: tetratricopeptide repeat protein [Microscillaceae bacterium]|nr:tetratricopeptide repeat protein [Microscillaceae bacterium]